MNSLIKPEKKKHERKEKDEITVLARKSVHKILQKTLDELFGQSNMTVNEYKNRINTSYVAIIVNELNFPVWCLNGRTCYKSILFTKKPTKLPEFINKGKEFQAFSNQKKSAFITLVIV